MTYKWKQIIIDMLTLSLIQQICSIRQWQHVGKYMKYLRKFYNWKELKTLWQKEKLQWAISPVVTMFSKSLCRNSLRKRQYVEKCFKGFAERNHIKSSNLINLFPIIYGKSASGDFENIVAKGKFVHYQPSCYTKREIAHHE